MNEVAVILRSLQLYAHQAHNLTKGQTFFQDHVFFGELYPAYEGEYDSVVERMIGLGQRPDIQGVNKKAAATLPIDSLVNGDHCFGVILASEKKLCQALAEAYRGASIGTQQLLGGIADASEVRQYKLKQRLHKEQKEA